MIKPVADAAFLDLVERIYEAASDPQLWGDFTRTLQSRFPFASASVLLFDTEGLLSPYAVNTGLADDMVRSYVEHYHAVNCYAPIFATSPSGSVVYCANAFSKDWLKKQTYYNEWLRPAGNLTSGACLIVERTLQHSMQVSIDMSERHENFERSSGELLSRLQPHLLRAFKLNSLLRGEAALTATVEGLIDNIKAAVFVLDSAGRSTNHNQIAEALMRMGRLKWSRTGHIRLHKTADQEKLDHAVAASAGTSPETPLPFRIHGSDGASMIVTVLPLRPREQRPASHEARMMVVIKPASEESKFSIPTLRSLYGLTLREAQVAALIADGIELQRAAEMLGVSSITARNQLASAMAKMGVSRQVEMVALLAKARAIFGLE